jgi:hypothetical protein
VGVLHVLGVLASHNGAALAQMSDAGGGGQQQQQKGFDQRREVGRQNAVLGAEGVLDVQTERQLQHAQLRRVYTMLTDV